MKKAIKTITYEKGVIKKIPEVVELSIQKDKLLSEIEELEMQSRELYRTYFPMINKFKGIRSNISNKWSEIEKIRSAKK